MLKEEERERGREERSELLSSLHLDFKGDVDAALIPSAPPGNRWRKMTTGSTHRSLMYTLTCWTLIYDGRSVNKQAFPTLFFNKNDFTSSINHLLDDVRMIIVSSVMLQLIRAQSSL